MKNHLDWSAYKDAGMGDAYADIPKNGGDFAKAVAACINSRQCEEGGKQVMCPSYRVSGNPNLSTGGRVRLLKAALSSDLVDTALTDQELHHAMTLCVACKGCKRECEANVDMALIKAEYLAQRRAQEGFRLRDRLFAHTPLWLHKMRWLRSLIQLRNRSTLLAGITERLLGVTASRALPTPAVKPFMASPSKIAITKPNAERKPEVVLLVDTFTRYFEPDIAESALKVLRAAGYHAIVAEPDSNADDRPLCCGRTYLAQGLVEKAREEAGRMLSVLKAHAAEGRIIVGLEASCVLGLRDDIKALGLEQDLIKTGSSVLLFEEFLAKELMAKRLDLPLLPLSENETLVHGHCHQKAMGATKAMRKVLKLIPEHRFSMIDASCCGMAGTFGLEAEHAEMATEMAEQTLLPALRANPAARVVANGFSCREQMRGHGDQRPRHLAVLLSEMLRPQVE